MRRVRLLGARPSGVLLILAASAAFGSNGVLAKLAFRDGFGVVTLQAFRYSAAAALLIPYGVIVRRRAGSGARGIGRWIAVGVPYTVASLAFFSAIKLEEVSRVAPIVYVYPPLVALIAHFAFREPLGWRRVSALAFGLGGSTLVLGADFSRSTTAIAGGLALLSAAATAAFYVAAGRALADDWVPAAATVFSVGALIFLALVPATGFETPRRAAGWILLATIATLGSLVPLSLFLLGVARIGPTHAAILSVFEPVVTVSLALAILGERLGALQGAGVLLILASFLISSVSRAPVASP